MTAMRMLVLAAAVAISSTLNAEPYVVISAWCNELPCNPNPIMHDPVCTYDFVCNRTEGPPQQRLAGTPGLVTSGKLKCDTCCEACRGSNPPTEIHVCKTRGYPTTPLPSREGLGEGENARRLTPRPALSPAGRGVSG